MRTLRGNYNSCLSVAQVSTLEATPKIESVYLLSVWIFPKFVCKQNGNYKMLFFFFFFLVHQMDTPVSSMKVAVRRRSPRSPYSFWAPGVGSGHVLSLCVR